MQPPYPPPPPSWIEGLDYYYYGGRMVLTARYLLARGHCCGNGCRHCPYNKPQLVAGVCDPGSEPGSQTPATEGTADDSSRRDP